MDVPTLLYYDKNAQSLANRYEMAEMGYTHRNLLRHLPEGGRVLEIGCGSGRDAFFLLNHGYEVTVVVASSEMLRAAIATHPELAGRIYHAPIPLPSEHPLLNVSFNALVMIATVMHISDQDLFECVSQIGRLLEPNGILFISTSIGREGFTEDRDSEGRIYVERQPDELQLLFERLGFRLIANYQNEDFLGGTSSGLLWSCNGSAVEHRDQLTQKTWGRSRKFTLIPLYFGGLRLDPVNEKDMGDPTFLYAQK